MFRPWIAVLAGLGCASLACGEATHPLTVDDVLATEMFGRAAFTPDGAWLAWNQTPPYDRLADYSYWLYAYRLSGHQVWIRHMETGEARLQPGLDPEATSYIFGLSPDSRYVVLIEHSRGRLRLISCRIGQDDCTRFEEMPDIRDRYISAGRYNERLVWTAPDRFVMPVRGPLQPGSEMRSRGLAGQYLWAEWNAAWDGRRPTASEVRSTAGAPGWAGGALAEFDLSSGAVRTIAEGRYAGIRLSPDGRTVLAARLSDRIRPEPGASGDPNETHPAFDRRYALSLISLDDGKVETHETPWSIDPHSLSWSPRGDRFAVYGWSSGETPAEGCYSIVPVHREMPGCVRLDGLELAGNREGSPWWTGPARAALLEAGLAVPARQAGQARLDWYLLGSGTAPRLLTGGLASPDSELLHADDTSLTLLEKGQPVTVTADATVEPRLTEGRARAFAYRSNLSHGWASEFRRTAGLIRYDFGRTLALILLGGETDEEVGVFLSDAAGPVRLETARQGARMLAASGPARALVYTARDGAATQLVLETPEGSVELARINSHLSWIEAPQTRQIKYRYTDPEGLQASRDTEACLVLPPDYEPGRRYPLLIEVYPAGGSADCPSFAEAPYPAAMVADLWAARGFIYVRPALPLDLARTPSGPLEGAGALFDQTVDALDRLGYADTGRVVLFGFSQGGALSLTMAAQTTRPRAIISMNGWADFFSHYYGARGLMRYFHLDQNGGDNRWRYECALEGPSHYCPFGFGMPASEDPGLYAALSPVARAGSVAAPVLLIHSDFDYFDMAQYDEMFGALYRAGKEARYVRYWGEGHGPSSPANIRDLWHRIDAFLAETGIIAHEAMEGTETDRPSSAAATPRLRRE